MKNIYTKGNYNNNANIIKFTKRYSIIKDEYTIYFDEYKIYNFGNAKGDIIGRNITEIKSKKEAFVAGTTAGHMIIEIEYNNKYILAHDYIITNRTPYELYAGVVSDDAKKIMTLLGARGSVNDIVKEITQDVKTFDVYKYKEEVFNHQSDWIVLNKTDGVKMILSVIDNKVTYLSNIVNNYAPVSNELGELQDRNIIIEGEFDNGFYAYDLLYDGEVIKDNYDVRLTRLANMNLSALGVRLKKYYDLANTDIVTALTAISNNKEESSDDIYYT